MFIFDVVVLISMFSMSPVFLVLSFFTGFGYSVILGGWKSIRFNLIFAVPVLFFTMIINPLSNHRGVTVLFYLNDNAITLEAILYGLASAAMLVSVVMWFSCFNKIMTSDKIILFVWADDSGDCLIAVDVLSLYSSVESSFS